MSGAGFSSVVMGKERPSERETNPLGRRVHPEADARARARDVDLNLVPDLLVKTIPAASEGGIDKGGILSSFSSDGRRTCGFGEGEVAL